MYPSSTLGEVENEPLLNTTVRRSGDGTSHIVVTTLIEKIIKSKKLQFHVDDFKELKNISVNSSS